MPDTHAHGNGLPVVAGDEAVVLKPPFPPPVFAGGAAGELAQLVPEVEAPGLGLDDEETGVDGMIGVGAEREFESGSFLGDGRDM